VNQRITLHYHLPFSAYS